MAAAADAPAPSGRGPRGDGVAGELAYLFVLKEAKALDDETFETAKELALSGRYPASRIVQLFLLYKAKGLEDGEFKIATRAFLEAAEDEPPGDDAPRDEGIAGELSYLFVLKEAHALYDDEFELAKELVLSGRFTAAKIVQLFLLFKAQGLDDREFAAAKQAFLEGRTLPQGTGAAFNAIAQHVARQEGLVPRRAGGGGGAAAAAGGDTPGGDFSITVKVLPDGPSVRVGDLDHGDTVADVKDKIFDETGIPPEQMRIVLSGKELDDERTLDDYGVVPGDDITVNCVLRLGA